MLQHRGRAVVKLAQERGLVACAMWPKLDRADPREESGDQERTAALPLADTQPLLRAPEASGRGTLSGIDSKEQ